jgi:hypothetical protein
MASDLANHFGDLSQIEKLSEINFKRKIAPNFCGLFKTYELYDLYSKTYFGPIVYTSNKLDGMLRSVVKSPLENPKFTAA